MHSLLEKVEKYVVKLLTERLTESYTYHNLNHTMDVVKASRIIASYEGLMEEELEILLVSAWFHDLGYIETNTEHELASSSIAAGFLKNEQLSDTYIKAVENCILATRLPQKPSSKMAKILCDADAYHLSQNSFLQLSLALREEWRALGYKSIKKSEFLKQSLNFIKNHRFHTQYGIKILEPLRQRNVELVEAIVKKNEAKKSNRMAKKTNKKLRLNGDKNDFIEDVDFKTSGRGVESMFRLTARNQINLSSIADNKANIMITINSLILSAVVTLLIRKIAENPNLLVPTFILFLVCIVSIVFAILATRPKISSGKFTREDIKKQNVNLLFFGNFYNMDLEEYEWAVKEMIKDSDYLYSNMIKDQYYLGKVLAKKYKMIRICYTVFMFGFIASILAFALTFIYFPTHF